MLSGPLFFSTGILLAHVSSTDHKSIWLPQVQNIPKRENPVIQPRPMTITMVGNVIGI
jgi:hypothetical protein